MESDPVGKGSDRLRREDKGMLVKELVIFDKGETTYEIRDVSTKGTLIDRCGKDTARVRYGKYKVYSYEITGKNKAVLNISP